MTRSGVNMSPSEHFRTQNLKFGTGYVLLYLPRIMSHNKRLFWILWLAGMAGVLSFLLVDLSALIALMPLPAGEAPPPLPPPALLKLISMIQPTVILTIAVLVGVRLGKRVGLHSPAAEAAAAGFPILEKLKPQILPGVAAGLISGVAVVLSWIIAKPFLPAVFVERSQSFNIFIPVIVRFLYGGLTEELLLRWGVMTFLVWAAWRLFQKGQGPPRSIWVIGAIVISAVMFGIGHLPLASMVAGGLTVPTVIYVVTGNSVFGLFAGVLYWRRGLEAAMIAHMSAHLVLVLAIALSF